MSLKLMDQRIEKIKLNFIDIRSTMTDFGLASLLSFKVWLYKKDYKIQFMNYLKTVYKNSRQSLLISLKAFHELAPPSVPLQNNNQSSFALEAVMMKCSRGAEQVHIVQVVILGWIIYLLFNTFPAFIFM